MKNNKALTEKEKLFCLYFSISRNARSAAAKAGYSVFTEKSAMKLIRRKEILKEIERIDSSKLVSTDEVISGYRQLAFGSVADAVKLIYSDENPDRYEIENLDLFNISEIKRPKSGGIEIKFFDRMKAIEHLEALSNGNNADDCALPFYMALEKSAAALREDNNEQ